MVAGRRSVSIHETTAWVFNRMADVYDARPPYPTALVDHLASLAGPVGSRIGDLGAGIGHLSLPLSARGFHVTAIEPALAMLERLRHGAREAGLGVRALHACAEALPLEPGSLDLAIVADALHFLDAEFSQREISRVLGPRSALALVTSSFGDTPFMNGVVRVMESAAPRRPRDMGQAIIQIFAETGIPLERQERFHDETAVDEETLERLLGSISFIGPAMNPERFTAFRDRIRALPGPRLWARTFTLHAGRRRRRPEAERSAS